MGLHIYTCEECGRRTISTNPGEWINLDRDILVIHPLVGKYQAANKAMTNLYMCPECVLKYEVNILGISRNFKTNEERFLFMKSVVDRMTREKNCHSGNHTWGGCTCIYCDTKRNQDHHWWGCKCTVCGMVKDDGHIWKGCKCERCGKLRDEQHEWDGCRCKKCNARRDESHTWDGCSCTKCYAVRDEGHEISNCQCAKCHRYFHTWDGCTCTVCGKVHSFKELNSTQHQCEICGLIESHNIETLGHRRDGRDTHCLSCSYSESTWGNDW